MGIADLQSQLGPFTDEGPEGREEKLSNQSSMLPPIADLSLGKILLEEAEKKMAEAREERGRLGSATMKTKSAESKDNLIAMLESEQKVEVADANYEDRLAKYEKSRHIAEGRLLAEHKEIAAILAAIKKAVSIEVLAILVPGAVGIGSRATPDGRIVTPGTLIEALKKYVAAQAKLTMSEAWAKMAAITKTLQTTQSSQKPHHAWPQLVAALRDWHHMMVGQVGCLTAPIVGRCIIEAIEA
jgi:hypothetical protein